jgi:hypothetical protein
MTRNVRFLSTMKRARSVVLSGVLAGSAFAFVSSEAAAQAVPPSAPRDSGFEIASNITMALGVATVTFMPRVYYSDPEATIGWKARWHVSQLAPALALTSITLLVDLPIKDAIESTRPGCTLDETRIRFPDSGCESFGGPSAHAFAATNAASAGIGIWVADTFIHSNSEVHAGSIIGNIAAPVRSRERRTDRRRRPRWIAGRVSHRTRLRRASRAELRLWRQPDLLVVSRSMR